MKLIFVYNASSSYFSQATDYVHKTLSPSTYQCNLCSITWGPLGEKGEWKNFIKSLNIDSEFLHKDELIKQFPENKNDKLPAVYKEENNKLHLLISKEEINKEKDISGLIQLVKSKLDKGDNLN